MPVTIWLNVDDLLHYAESQSRPSGIQRLVHEVCHALVACADLSFSVRFVAHTPSGSDFEIVPWSDVQSAFALLTTAASPSRQTATSATALSQAPSSRSRKSIRGMAYRLPAEIRQPLLAAYFEQRQAVREIGVATRAITLHASRLMRRHAARSGTTPVRAMLSAESRPGDILATLGAHWDQPGYPDMIAAMRRRGLRHALLVHDLIAAFRPEWCYPGLQARFRAFMERILPLADILLTTSRSNETDIRRFMATSLIETPTDPVVLPVGAGFLPASQTRGSEVSERIPQFGTFALCVSTIEARKNHVLLLHVWRRLLDELPSAQVPRLVFAGKVGWLVDDLMVQLSNCQFLGGHIIFVEEPDDAELEALYRRCLFTVYPSMYEGWGLPVTESLGFGRPCIAADASSLPEAGGRFARYFPSGNTTAAYAIIRDFVLNPDGLQLWEDEIAREYRPTSWEDTALALIAAIRDARATS